MVFNSKIKPIRASKKYYVNSTDEYPILFIIAALTQGISIFEGIKDLANKESNRIKEMQKILFQIGIKTVSSKDKLKIYGKGMIHAIIFNTKNLKKGKKDTSYIVSHICEKIMFRGLLVVHTGRESIKIG